MTLLEELIEASGYNDLKSLSRKIKWMKIYYVNYNPSKDFITEVKCYIPPVHDIKESINKLKSLDFKYDSNIDEYNKIEGMIMFDDCSWIESYTHHNEYCSYVHWIHNHIMNFEEYDCQVELNLN